MIRKLKTYIQSTTNNTDWISRHSKKKEPVLPRFQGNFLGYQNIHIALCPEISNPSICARTSKRHVVVILLSMSSQSVTPWYAIVIITAKIKSLYE